MRFSKTVQPRNPKPTKPRKVKLILVKWEDATHLADDTGPAPGTMIAWTTGFQLYKTKKEVALCMELFEDGAKRNISTIPMGMVKSILTLATLPIEVQPSQ